jgi:hypothetical protein
MPHRRQEELPGDRRAEESACEEERHEPVEAGEASPGTLTRTLDEIRFLLVGAYGNCRRYFEARHATLGIGITD